jgi:hypothetical protein
MGSSQLPPFEASGQASRGRPRLRGAQPRNSSRTIDVSTQQRKRSLAGVQVSPNWLVLTYLLHTIGELTLSPVGSRP